MHRLEHQKGPLGFVTSVWWTQVWFNQVLVLFWFPLPSLCSGLGFPQPASLSVAGLLALSDKHYLSRLPSAGTSPASDSPVRGTELP